MYDGGPPLDATFTERSIGVFEKNRFDGRPWRGGYYVLCYLLLLLLKAYFGQNFREKAVNYTLQDVASVFIGRHLLPTLLEKSCSWPSQLGVLRLMAALRRDVGATVANLAVSAAIQKRKV